MWLCLSAENTPTIPKINRLTVEFVSGIACTLSTSSPEIIVGSPTSTTPTPKVYSLSVGIVKEKVLIRFIEKS